MCPCLTCLAWLPGKGLRSPVFQIAFCALAVIGCSDERPCPPPVQYVKFCLTVNDALTREPVANASVVATHIDSGTMEELDDSSAQPGVFCGGEHNGRYSVMVSAEGYVDETISIETKKDERCGTVLTQQRTVELESSER